MPNFEPNSKIYLGNVPFDNSYRHTMTFSSKNEQYAYFASVCNAALDNTSYTYVRMNNSIRVPFNAERLYTYDYCMYQNANYGDKWFYAFIVGVNYINENMTEIQLQLDVMQTWYFDYQLTQGFVEREHVNDDTLGAHLNAEPPLDLQYDIHVESLQKEYPAYAIMLVTAVPNYKYGAPPMDKKLEGESTIRIGTASYDKMIVNDGQNPVSSGIIQRQFHACVPLLYDLRNNNSVKTLMHDIICYNICGIGDAIVDIFTVPEGAIGSNWITTSPFRFNKEESESYAVDFDFGLDVEHQPDTLVELVDKHPVYTPIVRGKIPSGVDVYKTWKEIQWNSPFHYGDFGYTPKNNKVYCYPYCYVEVGDFTGRKSEYKFEFFKNYWEVPGQLFKGVRFDIQEPVNADGIGYITPRDYNGGNTYNQDTESINVMPFTFSYTNKLPWSYSVYQNWAAQNQLVNELAVIGGLATAAVAVIPGISAATSALGAGAANSAMASGAASALSSSSSLKAASRIFAEEGNTVGMGIGIGGVAGVVANYDRMSRMPNEARGNTAGNSKIQCGYQGYYIAKINLKYEFVKIVDDFFSMYGYAVDRVKIPNITGRRNWNYVKMQNSCHRGNVPSDQMDMINMIYNKGITFWHTSDIGNYSLDNSIV